jgi:hypothetical protein
MLKPFFQLFWQIILLQLLALHRRHDQHFLIYDLHAGKLDNTERTILIDYGIAIVELLSLFVVSLEQLNQLLVGLGCCEMLGFIEVVQLKLLTLSDRE